MYENRQSVWYYSFIVWEYVCYFFFLAADFLVVVFTLDFTFVFVFGFALVLAFALAFGIAFGEQTLLLLTATLPQPPQ